MRWRARAAGCAALACLALGACRSEVPAADLKAPPVATARVRAVDLEERIEATGELQARLRSTLAAQVDGRVTRILRDDGDAVAAGQVVLEIDPHHRELDREAARARVAQAEARLQREQREAERVRELSRSNVASKSRLDEAETALALARADSAAARAELGVAEQALADASVPAPFAGLISRRHVNLGQYVQPGTALFDLVSLDPLDVVFHLAEVDSGRVAVGQEVAVRVAPHPGEVFQARVEVVSPIIDPETRTLRVKATVPNSDGRLRPGLFARADLGVSLRRGVPMVPEEAVLQRTDGSVVFRLVGADRVERRVVKLGSFHDASIEIVEGLAVGDVVVTRGHTDLVDGAVIRVVAPPEGAAASGLASAPGGESAPLP
jgi:membrane fusion protein (multidrug efflux system)